MSAAASAWRGRPIHWVALILAAAAATPAIAQSSPSYKLEEHALNSGGAPAQGQVVLSPGYTLTLVSLGDPLASVSLTSAGYRLGGGLVAANPPPREVLNMRWNDGSNLAWDGEMSVGVYNLYRGQMGTLPGGYGSCQAGGLTSAAAVESTTPLSRQAWFYLVTAENRLGEEGTKGSASNGSPRANPTPCP